MSHAGVKEYFQIECRMRGPRSIFKLTVARGGQRVFSNWMSHAGLRSKEFSYSLSHAGVQDYFQIECCTLGSKKIRSMRGIEGRGDEGDELLNTFERH